MRGAARKNREKKVERERERRKGGRERCARERSQDRWSSIRGRFENDVERRQRDDGAASDTR